jgi:hypothetical protein
MKLLFAITCTLIFYSCVITPEPDKERKFIYFNLSDDIIDKIEIKLIQDRTKAITDVINLNKSINRGDSLVFKYNAENFMNTVFTTQFFTTIYFRNQAPIFNVMTNEKYISGYFSTGQNVYDHLIYIGNKKMAACPRKRKDYPDFNPAGFVCELDSLYK